LSTNRGRLFPKWVSSKVDPLFNEVMKYAKSRIKVFDRIRNEVEFRGCQEMADATLHNEDNLGKGV